jgi:hypothetical protein
MKSIKQHISELEQTDWDYYSEIGNRELENPFTSRLSHKSFVEKYFKRSGKGAVLDFINYLPNRELNNMRTKHTNSIFFLGVLLYNKTNLHSDFFENLNSAEYRRFPFLWFLSCLFHDFGSEIENKLKTIEEIDNLSDLKNRYSIDNCLLETKPKEIYKLLFNEIENYFNLRLKSRKKIDHGIFAGLYFYDRLVKIRESKSTDNEETLFWGEELEEQYAQVATAIAVHNIWLPNEEDLNEYKEYHLDNLITDFKPIEFKDFPLLYLLGIVDTLDPIKIYMRDGFEPNEILESLELRFNENQVIFKNGDKSKLDFKKMTNNADGLRGWMNVEIDYNDTVLKLTLR